MTGKGSGIRIAATVVSLLYALALVTTGTNLPNSIARALSFLPTLLGLGAVAFDIWLWRMPFIRFFVDRPLLAGTWIGVIVPAVNNPTGNMSNRGEIEAGMVIEQTFWTLAFTTFTLESTSHSISAFIVNQTDSKRQKRVGYFYHNEPSLAFRHQSAPSNGATHFNVSGRMPKVMTGTYWTDRKSAGDLKFKYVGKRSDFSSLNEIKEFELEKFARESE